MSHSENPHPESTDSRPSTPYIPVGYAHFSDEDLFTVDSLQEYEELREYVHMSPYHGVIVDRHDQPWTVRTDVYGDLYGSPLRGHISCLDETALTAHWMLTHLSPARVIFI